MRTPLALAVLVVGGALAAAPALPDPSAADRSDAHAGPVSTAQDWREEFIKAYEIGDRNGMQRVAKTEASNVALWMYRIAERITRTEDPDEAKLYDAIADAWERAHDGSTFGAKVMAYFEGLDAEGRIRRTGLVGEYDALTPKYLTARGEDASAERDETLQTLGEQFAALGARFREAGDMYYASRAYVFAGDAFSPRAVREAAADPEREKDYLAAAVETCDEFDVKDRQHVDSRNRVRVLERAIESGATAGAEAKEKEPAKLPYEFGEAVTAPAEADTWEDLRTRDRLAYGWDDLYFMWPSVYLDAAGSTAFLAGASSGPVIERQGLTEIVTKAEDGHVEVYELDVEPTLVETRLWTGEASRPYAFMAQVGEQVAEFHGFKVNVEPTPNTLRVFMRPAAVAAFEIDGKDVFVTDDNLDGVFGGPPVETAETGLPKGVEVPRIDGAFVRRDKRAKPFSEVLDVDGEWYRVRPIDGGRAFSVAPAVDLPTGEVRLKFEGPDLEWLVIRGKDAGAGLFYALEHGDTIEVPVGSYRVYSGMVTSRDAKALMVAGDAKYFDVVEGERTDLSLGAPFGYEFTYTTTVDGVRVEGEDVVVTGAGGEQYHLLWNCRTMPSIYLREEGKTGWVYAGDTALIEHVDGITERGPDGWKQVWWPLDTTVENVTKADRIEVRLMERKNRLFGRIDSDAAAQ